MYSAGQQRSENLATVNAREINEQFIGTCWEHLYANIHLNSKPQHLVTERTEEGFSVKILLQSYIFKVSTLDQQSIQISFSESSQSELSGKLQYFIGFPHFLWSSLIILNVLIAKSHTG